VIGAADVAAAGRVTLETHLPLLLAAGVNGRPALPNPTSYNEVPSEDAIRRVKGSVLAVIVPGLRSTPERRGDGTYDAEFILSVAVWHEQTTAMPLLTAAADYNACVRAALLSHRTLGDLAVDTTWLSESVDLIGDGLTSLSLGLGITEFSVRIPNVADEVPLTGIGSDGPQVITSEVEVIPDLPFD